jgi:hypothetical protein
MSEQGSALAATACSLACSLSPSLDLYHTCRTCPCDCGTAHLLRMWCSGAGMTMVLHVNCVDFRSLSAAQSPPLLMSKICFDWSFVQICPIVLGCVLFQQDSTTCPVGMLLSAFVLFFIVDWDHRFFSLPNSSLVCPKWDAQHHIASKH